MANFKGGFAFNNEAAKVEVEQAPDGTLISCVNPVTGESLGGGNYSEVITGTADSILTSTDLEWLTMTALRQKIESHEIDVEIEFDLSALEAGMKITSNVLVPKVTGEDIGLYFSVALDSPLGIQGFISSFAGASGTPYVIQAANLSTITNGTATNITAYAANIPTKTTICYHPMPE